MPDLHSHFQYNDIETHMYASQWFLTLFTAKFPLPMVYSIMDLFLCYVSQLHAWLGGVVGGGGGGRMLIHIETHMYASQWFLTLFTAKFPLPMVYSIMDLFLCYVSQLYAWLGGVVGGGDRMLIHIETHMYASQWFLTLFTANNLRQNSLGHLATNPLFSLI